MSQAASTHTPEIVLPMFAGGEVLDGRPPGSEAALQAQVGWGASWPARPLPSWKRPRNRPEARPGAAHAHLLPGPVALPRSCRPRSALVPFAKTKPVVFVSF